MTADQAAARMRKPFRDFMEAAEELARNGFVVSIRPDRGDWNQQLYIFPASSVVAMNAAASFFNEQATEFKP